MSFSYSNFKSKFFSEFKISIFLALPLIASEVIYALNGFVATIMIAHLGKVQLAANAITWGIYLVVILFFIGLLAATGVMVAQSFGAKAYKDAGICFKQGLIMACIFALPMMLIMSLVPNILPFMHQDPAVVLAAKPFFYALLWSILPLNLLIVMQQFLTAINKAKMVMLVSVITVPIEIFFYYGFLFGKFGLPKLGLPGIGYGLTASYSMVSLFLLAHLLSFKQYKIYHLFHEWWKINRKFLFEMIRIGLPMGVMFCSDLALFAVIAIMMGILGTTILAAYQIAYQYLMIALTVIFAMTQTVMVRVGNEVGCNNREAIKLAALVNATLTIAMMLLFSICYIGFPKFMIRLDVDVTAPHLQSLVQEAAKYMAIIGVLILTDCIRLINIGALRSLKDTKFSMFGSIFGFWGIALPSAYLLAFKFNFGGVGVLWGLVIGLGVTGLIFCLRFIKLVKHVDLISLVTKQSNE